MDGESPKEYMSIRKRRNLSKIKAHTAKQREKTPEPSRTPVPHEDTTTSDDDDLHSHKNSREIEADKTYEEMKRLVQEKANLRDPVYDLDRDEVLEARAIAANEQRRRSISPFAVPDKEELSHLERKGSFIDPTNKLLSTNYTLSPKDEDKSRRSSISIDTSRVCEKGSSLSPSASANSSPRDKSFPYSLPSTPKKLEEIVYPDEVSDKQAMEKSDKSKFSSENEEVIALQEKDNTKVRKTKVPKSVESTVSTGELVTRVIQVERTPSKKLAQDEKPVVEKRERIVRTPSRKMSTDMKPTVVKQIPSKSLKEEPKSKMAPIKPARSKSATRLGSKTSESEMSEDQLYQQRIKSTNDNVPKRKVVPTPRRFLKNKSPNVNRSQSFNRTIETETNVTNGTEISQTSKEIIELMQKARARSLSIPKDDSRLPSEYKKYNNKNLQTPNKTPTSLRHKRGISCPKTIQIISDREILLGLTSKQRPDSEHDNHSRQSSGYIDASQSEYTSSCYSSSPSENEYEFDLSERTAELTRKLNLLSEEVDKRDLSGNIILAPVNEYIQKNNSIIFKQKPVLRKRSNLELGNVSQQNIKDETNIRNTSDMGISINKKQKVINYKWKVFSHWYQFKEEQKEVYQKIKLLRNRCICHILLLVIMCGFGGMMFKALEGSFENAYKCGTRNVKRDFIESLWRGSHYLREEDWKSMARKKLFEFEEQLHTAHEAGVTSYSGQRSWNFMNSFVYCLTLVTTIGYGHIAPKTTYGRVATIVYAIIGIPLFLIVLADFGKLFTRIIKFFWAFIRRFYYTRSCKKVRRTVPVQEVLKGLNIVYDVVRRPSQIFSEEDIDDMPEGEKPPPIERKLSDDVPPPLPPKPGTLKPDLENGTEPDTPAPSVFEIDDEFNLPISVAIVILIIYIIIGALAFNIWERWDFFESFYFVFISMSTIGLGDLVPDHPIFMMASILYLIFGLALTSMCINVVQVKLSDTFKQASAKLGATIGLKVAEEDGSLVPITPPPVIIAPVHKSKTEISAVDNDKSSEINDIESKNR
ncbi:unnamed protein product [Parnassius apollo]|uniref:(apollo) hypothetical protein n=1 Tax=Parnassius apollo TaxID=110799 RepID=A0A8S3WLZ6_PARAO|nr:unnamed protein product [Parnassius apollo]